VDYEFVVVTLYSIPVLMFNTSFQQSLEGSTSLCEDDIDEVDEDVRAEG